MSAEVRPAFGQMRIPDILETIADLSNDEVFTPPQLANKVLDLLPESIWSDSSITFLDPATKTGVFLREITKRLIAGLEDEIPDLQERVNHILTKQVYGLGITELTSLMSRRTVYCSTTANGIKSVCTEFDDVDGNIKFPDSKHTFNKYGKCEVCGAGEDLYYEEEGLDNYAYSFLHDNMKEVFGDVKFDVIIGNPPYQLMTGSGGSQATPLYHKFIEKAIEMNPEYISMIVPSRWFLGGMGLNDFRNKMLNDNKIVEIVNYVNSMDLFPHLGINGGINYFLWDRKGSSKCKFTNISPNGKKTFKERKLKYKNEDIIISDNIALEIVEKVNAPSSNNFSSLVSSAGPYGKLNSKIKSNSSSKDLFIYGHKKEGFISTDEIESFEYNHKNKIFISLAYGGNVNKGKIINTPFIPKENSVCSETYLSIGPFKSLQETENAISYMKTKMFRFLVYTLKKTQHGTQKVYRFVPLQDFSKSWTDEELYAKYKLTDEEIAYIEENIEEMK